MTEIPIKDITKVRVSSVLNKDGQCLGRKNIFDGSPDTCWNSDEGSPQWVFLEFKEPYKILSFNIEFQGGFVGQDCSVEMSNDGKVFTEPFYPEDKNGIQKFFLSKPESAISLKFWFNKSTDFFGRIVIYSMNIFGE